MYNHLTAIVLAAGQSVRMGAVNKLLLPYGEGTIIERVVGTLREAGILDIVVVTGAEQQRIMAALDSDTSTVRFVHNPNYIEGMGTSLQVGIEATDAAILGYLIVLGDMPLLQVDTIHRLCRAFNENPAAIVVATIQGRRGHPVLFPMRFRKALLALDGDSGARFILNLHATSVVPVPVDDVGIIRDIDTPRDYEALVQP